MTAWTIIPDVHADMDRLLNTMSAAGFSRCGEGWRHPEGVKALFLGDLIDNGPRNAEVVSSVRSMVGDGEALCLMGNHELNAVLLHAGLRERSPKNLRQHESFLREMAFGSREADDLMAWFRGLPLRADAGLFRAAHAYWGDDAAMSGFPTRSEHGLTLTHLPREIWSDIGEERGPEAYAVLDLIKGPELFLPEGGFGFNDHYGHWRTSGRARWWKDDPASWEEALISLGTGAVLPAGAPPAARTPSYDHPEPLFIGHYKMTGELAPVSERVFCLDFPADEPFASVTTSGEVLLCRTEPDAPRPH